ncbi:hypothetical protein BN970_05050 [Mycolicibacterium conceptionense]|uniref:Uncharacterized protein n=1 Tax=Mycolicibacterium conceptionense TaxID=451644 RepID=A0A0U1DTJ3_9MYCO|nr:hypothetical protein BN970_05050 [Mycolicibacterium conceptionense]
MRPRPTAPARSILRRGLASGQHEHQSGLARAVRPRHRDVFAWLQFHRHRAQRVALDARVAEPHIGQPERYGRRGCPLVVVGGVEFVDVGDPEQPGQDARQCPPTDHAHGGDAGDAEEQHEQRPVVQHRGEGRPQWFGRRVQHRNALQDRGDPFDTCAQRIEDQAAQSRQHGQRRDDRRSEQCAGHDGSAERRAGAAPAAFDHAGQSADVGAIDDRHRATHARDQRDRAGGDGRGQQDPQPIAVGQQPHRHRAQNRKPARERHHHGDDRGGRTQRRHHRSLRELARGKAAPRRRRRGFRGHRSILPAAIAAGGCPLCEREHAR